MSQTSGTPDENHSIEAPRPIDVSIEEILHYRCGGCGLWWSVADLYPRHSGGVCNNCFNPYAIRSFKYHIAPGQRIGEVRDLGRVLEEIGRQMQQIAAQRLNNPEPDEQSSRQVIEVPYRSLLSPE